MAGDLRKTVKLVILADDAEAQKKIDEISLKADRLAEKNPEIDVKIRKAEFDAQMAVLKGELKEAGKLDIKPHVDKGDLAKAEGELSLLERFNGGGGGNGFFSALDDLPYGGLPALAAVVPLVAALTTEVVGLAAGLTAAGAGFGAFALLALPTFDKIKNAYTAISAAQTAYSTAVAKERLDPTKANATAAANALVNLKVAEDNMTPSTRTAIHSIEELKSTYEKMAKAFQPVVMKVFNDGLKIANILLPTLKGPATDFGNAIDGLLKHFEKFTQSQGFKTWLKQFDTLIGPSVTAIGTGIGKVATSFGKLMTSMSSKDVVHAVNIAFGILSGTLGFLESMVTHSMARWDQMKRVFRDVENAVDVFRAYMRKNLDEAGHYFEEAYDTVKRWATNSIGAVERFRTRARADLDQAGTDVQHWAGDVVRFGARVITWFGQLPGRILHAIGDLGGMLFKAGANAFKGLLSGMQSMVPRAIRDAENWGHDIISAIGSPFGIKFSEPSEASKMIKAGRNIAMGLGIGMRSGAPSVSAAAAQLARSAGISGSGSAAAGGGRIVLEIAGSDQQILTAFAHALRVRGGSPSLIGLKT